MNKESFNKAYPLSGKRILITRAKNQAGELSALIEEKGGEAIEFPVIKIIPPKDSRPYQEALEQLDTFDWVIFTSVNGVNSFFSKLKEYQIDIRRMVKAAIAAIGPKTAQAIQDRGLIVDIVPQTEYKAEGLLEALKGNMQAGEKVLLPRADIARKTLSEKLVEQGLNVVDIVAYQTVTDGENKSGIIQQLKENQIDFITFTSSSTVKNFLTALKDELLTPLIEGAVIASIGPITTKTAEELGLKVHITAEEYTIPGLIRAIENYIDSHIEL